MLGKRPHATNYFLKQLQQKQRQRSELLGVDGRKSTTQINLILHFVMRVIATTYERIYMNFHKSFLRASDRIVLCFGSLYLPLHHRTPPLSIQFYLHFTACECEAFAWFIPFNRRTNRAQHAFKRARTIIIDQHNNPVHYPYLVSSCYQMHQHIRKRASQPTTDTSSFNERQSKKNENRITCAASLSTRHIIISSSYMQAFCRMC